MLGARKLILLLSGIFPGYFSQNNCALLTEFSTHTKYGHGSNICLANFDINQILARCKF